MQQQAYPWAAFQNRSTLAGCRTNNNLQRLLRNDGLQLTPTQPLPWSVLTTFCFSLALDHSSVGTIFHFHHHCLIFSSSQLEGIQGGGGGSGCERGRNPAKQSCPSINWRTITLFLPASHNLAPLATLHLIG